MANLGNKFRDSLINMILDWNIEELKIYREPYVGSRFIGAKRKLDIILEPIFRTSKCNIKQSR